MFSSNCQKELNGSHLNKDSNVVVMAADEKVCLLHQQFHKKR